MCYCSSQHTSPRAPSSQQSTQREKYIFFRQANIQQTSKPTKKLKMTRQLKIGCVFGTLSFVLGKSFVCSIFCFQVLIVQLSTPVVLRPLNSLAVRCQTNHFWVRVDIIINFISKVDVMHLSVLYPIHVAISKQHFIVFT